MDNSDPLVMILTGFIVDFTSWLDSCGDDEVALDSAVKIMEHVAAVLRDAPPAQRPRFLDALDELAHSEQDPNRRDAFLAFPHAIGLADSKAGSPGSGRTRRTVAVARLSPPYPP
ncbi:hypothetical protein ACFWPH_17785 [Nocardia sp. NPDC058499]|uniref:hypothetical protein n=1 Tax=Nocardia sp. NPDC058499 TaxID=3346530 RepID=UPI00364A9159